MQNKLEKFGSFGAILAAAACPICFPKLALLGAVLGLGALAKFETVFFFASQALVILALIGHALSFKRHQNRTLFALATVAVVVFFVSMYALPSEIMSYAALTGLVIATVWLIVENRRCLSCETPVD